MKIREWSQIDATSESYEICTIKYILAFINTVPQKLAKNKIKQRS